MERRAVVGIWKRIADTARSIIRLRQRKSSLKKVTLMPNSIPRLRQNEYYGMQATFDRLHAQSAAGSEFKHLMGIISSEDNIRLAYRVIKSNKGSRTPGTDGKTIEDISKMAERDYVEAVQNKLKWYQPKAVRRVEIPKPNGKMRPLGIPTIMDRIVQQCILQVLEPICEAKFSKHSHGFRPDDSAEHAFAEVYGYTAIAGLRYVVDVDIKGFFDNVDHGKLIRQMWAMGIHDKKLICVVKAMLKAPILMPDGEVVHPDKGTPQGGVLSPLLANIVLNELDWWVVSQWEQFPTRHEYSTAHNKFKALKKTGLKEMRIVRYADDFKVFCRTRRQADKAYAAIKSWLAERLKLEVSPEKSKVVDLRRSASEFLGIQFKLVRKGNRYANRSHVQAKALARMKRELRSQIRCIKHAGTVAQQAEETRKYSSMVAGMQNYYCYATMVSADFGGLGYSCRLVLHNALGDRLRKQPEPKGAACTNQWVLERHGASKQLRFVATEAVAPVGHVRFRAPMYKPPGVNRFTAEGRKPIHRSLEIDGAALAAIRRGLSPTESIELRDNVLSKFCAQQGKCAVTGTELGAGDLCAHRKAPWKTNGADSFENLTLIHKDVAMLIECEGGFEPTEFLRETEWTDTAIGKMNRLRELAGKEPLDKMLFERL